MVLNLNLNYLINWSQLDLQLIILFGIYIYRNLIKLVEKNFLPRLKKIGIFILMLY